MVFVLLLFGPYDGFYVELSPWLYAPQAPFSFLPNLGDHFWTLKYSVMGLAVLSLFNSRVASILFAGTFLVFNFYVKSFSTTWWITNTHLNFFAIALCFVPEKINKRDSECASFLLAFMILYVTALYFQAGVSKLIHGGIGWFFNGHRIWTETLLLGTSFGKWLTQWPQVFTFMSFGTGVFELIVPAFFLIRTKQRYAAFVAILFHAGTFIVMGISFWFLWVLYPALFLMEFKGGLLKSKMKSPEASSALKKDL